MIDQEYSCPESTYAHTVNCTITTRISYQGMYNTGTAVDLIADHDAKVGEVGIDDLPEIRTRG